MFQVTVPKIVVLIRKGYGQALLNMGALGVGADFMVAWPTAEINFMQPEIAVDIVFGSLSEEQREKMIEKFVADSSPYPAARVYGIQDVIHPMETREYLIKMIRIVRDSSNRGIRKHLLAGWPTKF